MKTIMKFNAIGPISVSGLGNAFEMHSEALAAFHSVERFSVHEDIENEVENTYYHGAPKLAERVNTTGRNIAYWVCESTKLSLDYLHNVHAFDDIWTASTYCQRILAEQLDRDVKVVPHCVTRFKYKPQTNAQPIILVPFDGHSRFVRKNPLASIKAVRDAFGDKCKLVIKGKNVRPSFQKWLIAECEGLDALFIWDKISYEELDQLYALVDIVLSLHSAEGFGLHLLEGMAFGKKVVATDWGGNTDFMASDNSFLVDAKEVDVTDEFFHGTWGQPVHDAAVEQLRAAATADQDVCLAAFDTALKFSMINTIRKTQIALG